MTRSKTATPRKDVPTAEAAWRELAWEDLKDWAGDKAVERGKKYQEEGRVEDLALARQGELLATVSGNEEYATHVWLEKAGKRPRPQSECTCPVGFACKHAVAVAVEYLKALADRREIPVADEDDPRWYDLDAPADDGLDDQTDGRPKRSARASKEWDFKIQAHLRAMPQEALVDLAWSMAKASAREYDALRERIALQELDPGGLIAEARREIKAATKIDPWRNHWDGAGELPDYRPVHKLLKRLLELGRADDVVKLGRELIKKGMDQVSRSDDEGETMDRLNRCLPVVFEAVARSSLKPAERLLFAVDAELDDPSDVVGDAADTVLKGEYRRGDWSDVADALADRLGRLPAPRADDHNARYRRKDLVGWLIDALEEAGRESELPALYESEARLTGDREQLIAYLIEEGRLDDAEREARRELAERIATEPGTAARLARILSDLASRRRRWDVVAAHAAREFFDKPGLESYRALMKAAAKAGVEPAVREGALKFLKTGLMPYEAVEAKPRRPVPKKAGKAKAAPKPATAGPEAAAGPGVKVDPAWPLPVPEELLSFLHRGMRFGPTGPRWGVLIDLAIADRKPEEALAFFDSMKADQKRDPYYRSPGPYADRVAEVVTKTHPDRALAIFRESLDRLLPETGPAAYQSCADYLARMHPLYRTLGRPDDWAVLVASIREKYRNRPRFMEQLDRTLGRMK